MGLTAYNVYFEDEKPPMSDFKVGDVVKCNISLCPCDGELETISQIDGSSVRVASGWASRNSITRVSRPSDAKPALKAGDRVRVLIPGPYRGDDGVVVHDAGPQLRPHRFTVRLETSHYGFDAHELELLPPESPDAKPICYDIAYGCDCNPLGMLGHPCVCHAKPMTATAASILYENAKHGADGMTLEEVEAFRHAILASHPVLKTYWDKPADGWMPAGTYMPTRRELPRMPALSRPNLRPQEARNGIFLPKVSKDGNISTLAGQIPPKPLHTRLQTSSWDPVDDTFLEDA